MLTAPGSRLVHVSTAPTMTSVFTRVNCPNASGPYLSARPTRTIGTWKWEWASTANARPAASRSGTSDHAAGRWRVSPLPDACAAITTWLPQGARLIPEQDIDGTSDGENNTSWSHPPWNPEAATAALDAHEGLRRLEASLRYAVTGHTGKRRGGSDANTYQAIHAIENLGNAMTAKAAAEAARILDRWSLAICQLAAIDEAERWQKVSGAACPYCGHPMLRLSPRSGRVTCLRFGVCFDRDGKHPQGQVDHSVSGEPMVSWQDGLCQYAAMEAT